MDDNRDHPNHRFATPWSLPEDDAAEREPNDVVDLTDARLVRDRAAHCPACQGHPMETVATDDGRRYEHCLSCGRLWNVHDGRLELAQDVDVLDRR